MALTMTTMPIYIRMPPVNTLAYHLGRNVFPDSTTSLYVDTRAKSTANQFIDNGMVAEGFVQYWRHATLTSCIQLNRLPRGNKHRRTLALTMVSQTGIDEISNNSFMPWQLMGGKIRFPLSNVCAPICHLQDG